MNSKATDRCWRELPLRLACLTAVVIAGCQVAGAAEADPDAVLARAQAAIVARVGDTFFRDYIESLGATSYPPNPYCTENPSNCSEVVRKEHSLVTFRLRIPELPFVDELLGCVVASDGTISDLAAPKCVSDPRECTFPYDETAAQTIASAAGLQPGRKAWELSFHWHYGLETFVWTVSNTLHEAKHSGDGQIVLIDANDGRVLSVSGWHSFD